MYPEPLHRLPHAVLAPFSSLLRSSALIQIIQLEGDEPGRRLWREREGALTTLSLLATAHPALKATLALLGDLAQRVAERTALALMLNDNYRVVQRQVGPRCRPPSRLAGARHRHAASLLTLPTASPCCSASSC
jgi:hypothetical protein